jgi:cation diffusion facilitator CzcD-associated flavoprotein CzcO
VTVTITPETQTTDFDVLIIGAGISGIDAAYHLKTRRPQTSFAVLEDKEAIGGTWNLFRYPGIRSDSDMPTFGYSFKPWTSSRSLADADSILDYLRETIAEHRIGEHLRFGYRVISADFCSRTQRWTVTARRTGAEKTVEFTARFLYCGTGYYSHDNPYTPEFDGAEDFAGRLFHPQHWPADLDYAGKKVVVIGSGATAVTLIPAMADVAGHVTMLQRSPSYIFSLPTEDVIQKALTKVIGAERAYPIVRRKNIFLYRGVYKACRRWPRAMRKVLIGLVRRQLPRGYDVATHFSPRYNPWDERLCAVPGNDLFKAISAGDASVVTGHIERFTETGIRLQSGQHLDADIIITATGLNMLAFGAIRFSVDGEPVALPDTTAYKAMMVSGLPNFVFAFGYTNISWTLKVDLVCDHFCRMLDHMDAHGYATVVPVLDDPGVERDLLVDFTPGYMRRGLPAFPRSGDSGPWTAEQAYEKDVERLRDGPIDDPALRFTAPRPARVTT